jgi:regulator of sigma E protease
MFTLVVFFLVLSLLVVIHELGHFIAAKLQGIKVEEFGFGIPPRIWGIRFGETLYSINLLPFGGFVKVFGEEEASFGNKKLSPAEKKQSFAHKKHWQKALVLVAGVFLNFVLGWVIVTYLFTQGVPTPTTNIHIEEVTASSPAAEAGLRKGDVITSIHTASERIIVDETTDIAEASKKYAGSEIVMDVNRNGNVFTISITPRENPPKGQGALGIMITNYEIKKYSLAEAPVRGLIEAAKVSGLIGKELGKTLFKFVTLQEQDAEIAGPIGIAQLTSKAAHQGIDALLQLIGLLSLNLAVLNILPFPALDGGRLAFVLYEWATRRKVNPQFEQRLNFAGFSLLIGLLILVTINDLLKLIR